LEKLLESKYPSRIKNSSIISSDCSPDRIPFRAKFNSRDSFKNRDLSERPTQTHNSIQISKFIMSTGQQSQKTLGKSRLKTTAVHSPSHEVKKPLPNFSEIKTRFGDVFEEETSLIRPDTAVLDGPKEVPTPQQSSSVITGGFIAQRNRTQLKTEQQLVELQPMITPLSVLHVSVKRAKKLPLTSQNGTNLKKKCADP